MPHVSLQERCKVRVRNCWSRLLDAIVKVWLVWLCFAVQVSLEHVERSLLDPSVEMLQPADPSNLALGLTLISALVHSLKHGVLLVGPVWAGDGASCKSIGSSNRDIKRLPSSTSIWKRRGVKDLVHWNVLLLFGDRICESLLKSYLLILSLLIHELPLLSFFVILKIALLGVREEMELSNSKVELDLVFACFDDLNDPQENVFEDVKNGRSRASYGVGYSTCTHLNDLLLISSWSVGWEWREIRLIFLKFHLSGLEDFEAWNPHELGLWIVEGLKLAKERADKDSSLHALTSQTFSEAAPNLVEKL